MSTSRTRRQTRSERCASVDENHDRLRGDRHVEIKIGVYSDGRAAIERIVKLRACRDVQMLERQRARGVGQVDRDDRGARARFALERVGGVVLPALELRAEAKSGRRGADRVQALDVL